MSSHKTLYEATIELREEWQHLVLTVCYALGIDRAVWWLERRLRIGFRPTELERLRAEAEMRAERDRATRLEEALSQAAEARKKLGRALGADL